MAILICNVCGSTKEIKEVKIEEEIFTFCEEHNWNPEDLNICYQVTKIFEETVADYFKGKIKN